MDKVILTHGRDYFSPSQIKKLTVSLGAFNEYLFGKKEDNYALTMGTLVHCLTLEPKEFKKRYVVFDDTEIVKEIGGAKPRGTKKYKEHVTKFNSQAKGKTVISVTENFLAKHIHKKMKDAGVIDTFFTGGEAEVTRKGEVEYGNRKFDALAIVDYDTDFQSADLKTTSKPLDKFKWDADAFGYDIQASLTNRITGKDFVFVVVQTVRPYDIGIYTCGDFFMERGQHKIIKALDNYENYNGKESSQVLEFEL